MARYVKSFIGGLTSRVTGGDSVEPEAEEVTSPPSSSPLVSIELDQEVEEREKTEHVAAGTSADEAAKEDEDDPRAGSLGRIKVSPVASASVSSEEGSQLNHDSHEEDSFEFEAPSQRGSLHKWTNYLRGWQERFFLVKDGVLSYFKSEFDTQYGCRGSVSLHKVKILLHEFDELRFDVRARDCTYFLRASSVDEKGMWVEAIEANQKYLSDSGIDTITLQRQGSILSLSGLSQTSTTSFKVGHDLQTKLAELDTYRDILCRQVDTLQAYFDTLAESPSSASGQTQAESGISNSAESLDNLPEEDTSADSPSPTFSRSSEPRSPVSTAAHHSPLPSRFTPKGHRRTGSDPFAFRQPPHIRQPPYYLQRSHVHFQAGGGSAASSASSGVGSTTGPIDVSSIDFRGEAITFKATTAGIIMTLAHCMELMNKREEHWQKRFEKEQERRRRADMAAHAAMNGPRVKAYEYAGPDFVEGPHIALNEDEFFDALEMAYQNDENEQNGERVESHNDEASPGAQATATSQPYTIVHNSITGITHRLTPLVDEKTSQYAKYIFEPVDANNWSVVHEDGDMKVYRKELEEEGVVVDPLRASYVVDGLSAHEVIHYFFDKETRMEWEGTLESFEVVEMLAEDTVIYHQLHKRVWPSTQRETLYCSHLCTLENTPRGPNDVGRTWMVSNFSINHPDRQVTSKFIRATLHIGMMCQTIAKKPVVPGKESELTRDDISCNIVYAANVNPGGWAPPSVVRAIGKRELCKFLKKFSATVHKNVSSSPLTL